jgi:hypothetical protein
MLSNSATREILRDMNSTTNLTACKTCEVEAEINALRNVISAVLPATSFHEGVAYCENHLPTFRPSVYETFRAVLDEVASLSVTDLYADEQDILIRKVHETVKHDRLTILEACHSIIEGYLEGDIVL